MRKCLNALLIAVIILNICSCVKNENGSEDLEIPETPEISEVTEIQEAPDATEEAKAAEAEYAETAYIDDAPLEDAWELMYIGNSNLNYESFHQLTSKEQADLTKIYDKIIAGGNNALPKDGGDCLYIISGRTNGKPFTISKYITDYEYYIGITSGINSNMFFAADRELDDFTEAVVNKKRPAADTSSSEDIATSYTKYSFNCDEPITRDEYVGAAKGVCKLWLDSLKNETGAYRLKSYVYNNEKIEFITSGIVNGVKEFVVLIVFDADGGQKTADDRVWTRDGSAYYGRFFNMYKGSLFYARCYWEDGAVKIKEISNNVNVASGLYGLIENNTGYETFFDFANDAKSHNLDEMTGIIKDYKISRNVTMLNDGSILLIEIALDDDDGLERRDNGKIYGRASQRFYFYGAGADLTGKPYYAYGSPVNFVDGYGPREIEYTEGFKLIFDDYNNDGNPDTVIKIDGGDENGSMYSLLCIDSDGSPRANPSHEEFYMAGHFDDSIRLQKVSANEFVKWEGSGADGKKTIIPNKEIDNYRMYSQKYYSPGHLKLYHPGTKDIICYFWNNTASPVTTGATYDIEKRQNGEWVIVSAGNPAISKNVDGFSQTEITFDISGINAETAEYRIALYINGEKIYGGFYLGSELPTELSVTAESDTLPADRTRINFTVHNTGVSEVYLNPTAVLLKDGVKITEEIIANSDTPLKPGDKKTVTVSPEEADGLFAAGEYTPSVGAGEYEFLGNVTLKQVSESERYVFSLISAKRSDGGFTLEIKNNYWSRETASGIYIIGVHVLRDGVWVATAMRSADAIEEIPYGKSLPVSLVNLAETYLNDEDGRLFFEEIKASFEENPEALKDYFTEEEYEAYLNMTYENFIAFSLGIDVTEEILSGDICRITVTSKLGWSQYIYFTAP